MNAHVVAAPKPGVVVFWPDDGGPCITARESWTLWALLQLGVAGTARLTRKDIAWLKTYYRAPTSP